VRRALFLVASIVLSIVVAGCGGSSRAKTTNTIPSSVPRPNLARIVPTNYIVKRVWHANLSGQAVPEVVVSSKGPAVGELGFHPAELQVVSWDPIAKRWNVIFDAQKYKALQQQFGTVASNEYITSSADLSAAASPILDPTAEGDVNQVAFVHFGGQKRADLVFSTTQSYGGSGSPGNLAVVGFQGGEANLLYLWYGDGGAGFKVAGSGLNQTLAASAQFWTPVDAHCCPIRAYNFVIGSGGAQGITSIKDDRPWLGLFVKAEREMESSSPVRVIGVVPGSPAESLFREGDMITALVGAKVSKDQGLLGPALIDQVALLEAGASASFKVERGGRTITITAKLGSYVDPSAESASPPNDLSVIAI
jgi:hypothetical protein